MSKRAKNVFLFLLLLMFVTNPIKKIVKNGFFPTGYIERHSNVILIRHSLTIGANVYHAIDNHNFMKSKLEKECSWNIISNNIDTVAPHNIVVIIGESVRKDFLHSYGFPIENTPFIDSSTNIQFDNYISVGANTIPSVLRTIAFSDSLNEWHLNNNIFSLSKKVGYKTFFISNQGESGVFDTPIASIGKMADNYHFLNRKNYTYVKCNSDIQMIPYFDDIISENNSKQLIVIHMYGSHPAACSATCNEYDEFIVSQDISCYNKTIKNLDSFLNNIYITLLESNHTFDMIYFSDHGLRISENNTLVHGPAYKQSYQIPLILWNDKLTEKRRINAIRQNNDFMHLFCEILDIKTDNIKRNYTFISEQKNEDKDIQIDYNKKYDELMDNDVNILFKK